MFYNEYHIKSTTKLAYFKVVLSAEAVHTLYKNNK